MIKNIIFDFDGVIHDTYDIALSINKNLDPTYTEEDLINHFKGNLREGKKKMINASTFFEMQEKEFEKLIIDESIKKELLRLNKDYNFYIITSNSENTLKRYLDRNNLSDLFIEVLGYETHRLKAEKFKMLIKNSGLSKESCIFVTDTLGDIIEANQVEIKTIAVDFGFHSKEVLEEGKPFKIISDFSQIGSILEEMR